MFYKTRTEIFQNLMENSINSPQQLQYIAILLPSSLYIVAILAAKAIQFCPKKPTAATEYLMIVSPSAGLSKSITKKCPLHSGPMFLYIKVRFFRNGHPRDVFTIFGQKSIASHLKGLLAFGCSAAAENNPFSHKIPPLCHRQMDKLSIFNANFHQ
jgi:hypothetical protein